MDDLVGSMVIMFLVVVQVMQVSCFVMQSWSEMFLLLMMVLLCFLGKNLWEVLYDDELELEIYDFYQVVEVILYGQQVLLVVNFIVGYVLWLVCFNFS